MFGIILWIVFGIVVGHSQNDNARKTKHGLANDRALGIVGSIVGGFVPILGEVVLQMKICFIFGLSCFRYLEHCLSFGSMENWLINKN
jgi:uncharacterized membrane protein YeaQ/YmgE (transglycosylase-associated protein family)